MAASETTAYDRFNDALRTLDEQVQELRQDIETRRDRFERDVRDRAKDASARFRKSELYRIANRTRRDWEGQLDNARTSLYEMFGVATQSDIEKLNKKLNSLSRKLDALTRDARDEEPVIEA